VGKYGTLGSAFDRIFRNTLNKALDDVDTDINAQKKRVDDLITGTPQPSEVVDARGGFPVLRDRLEDVTSSLAQIATVNISQYPRLTGETHDIPRINRAITYLASIGGGELRFNDETYTLIPQKYESGENSTTAALKRIKLKSNVSLVGKKGKTIFKVSDNNPNYHALIEEHNATVDVLRNVTIKGITFEHNVYNNVDKPDPAINNHKECFRIYKSENVTITDCKIICNGTNPLNFRMGLNQAEINAGNYPNKKITFKDNEIVFVGLDLTYYDNTFITFTGEDMIIQNNKIKSERVSTTQVSGENTAIEVAGKNIVCSDNVIENYLLGIDVAAHDTFANDRNIKVIGNKISDCARGIKLWGGYNATYTLDGVSIDNNTIVLNLDLYKSRTESSTRCAIGLSNHTSGSLGTMRNIKVANNKISMGNVSRDYLLTLAYPGSYTYSLSFDAHFNGIFLGGTGQIPNNIVIRGNEFKNLPCPSVYTGHSNLINDVDIIGNTFIDCGYGQRSGILTFSNRNQNFTISNNVFLDKGTPTLRGKILYAFKDGNYQASKFWECVFTNNNSFVKVNNDNFTIEFNTYLYGLIFDRLIMDIAPNVAPMRVGTYWIDKTNKIAYISLGTSSTTDWVRIS
jgi:hypothetical protein